MFLSLASRPLLFSERTRRAQAPGTEAAFSTESSIRIVCFSFSVGCSCFPSRSSNSTRTAHWTLHQSNCPVPALPRSSSRANSSHDPPVVCVYGCCSSVSSGVIWGLCPLQPCQSPSDLGVLVSVSYTPAGHQFVLLLFQFVEECLKVRPHVRECKLRTVCSEETQQCFSW